MIKISKEKLIIEGLKKFRILNVLKTNHNELINKYPNIAIFAFDRIGADISILGIYEKEVLEGLKDFIFNKIDTQKSVCLDVGANIGNHSLYFAQFFNQVYSIEPHPEIFELLKFNFEHATVSYIKRLDCRINCQNFSFRLKIPSIAKIDQNLSKTPYTRLIYKTWGKYIKNYITMVRSIGFHFQRIC